MKPATVVSFLAFIISIGCLVLALLREPIESMPTEKQIEEAVAERERQMVRRLKPAAESIYDDILGPDEAKAYFDNPPRTVEELYGNQKIQVRLSISINIGIKFCIEKREHD